MRSYRIKVEPSGDGDGQWEWSVYENIIPESTTQIGFGWSISKAQAIGEAERYCDSRSEAVTYTYTPPPAPGNPRREP